jgi:hypothetical protein
MIGSSGLGLAGIASGYATRVVAAASGAVWLPTSFIALQQHVEFFQHWIRP